MINQLFRYENDLFILTIKRIEESRYEVREFNKTETNFGATLYKYATMIDAYAKALDLMAEWVDAINQVNNDNNN